VDGDLYLSEMSEIKPGASNHPFYSGSRFYFLVSVGHEKPNQIVQLGMHGYIVLELPTAWLGGHLFVLSSDKMR